MALSAAAHAAAHAAQASSMALGQALSGVFGSISLTAWICLLLPQLWANYRAQSADGLSLAFLVVWSLGDVTNLSGALLTNLAPSAIALAIYFCILDATLISQCFYYNTLNARRRAAKEDQATNAAASSENSPLLAERRDSVTGHASSSQHGARRDESPSQVPSTKDTADEETPGQSTWTYNALSLLAVYAIGIAGWFVSYMAGAWDGEMPKSSDPADESKSRAIAGLTLGYASAAFYLCARIPQIVKNYREKSCEGLSLLFFMLSLTGNFTYGVSLVAYSQGSDYLVKALPWLLGSLGTMIEDATIFVQFRLYAGGTRTSTLE
ncbi:hypothetical protein HIM_01527 [Hirsutella minnesotensis 3608]|nr:hypothetical protein HIM_01527 [Hirsutella minnesotensis 3608]